jgi:hypothetical protein
MKYLKKFNESHQDKSEGMYKTTDELKELIKNPARLKSELDSGLNIKDPTPYVIQMEHSAIDRTGQLLRIAIKGSYKSKDDIGESYLESFKLLIEYGAKTTDTRGRDMVLNRILLKTASEYYRKDIIDYLVKNNLVNEDHISRAIHWMRDARRINNDLKEDMINYLKSL